MNTWARLRRALALLSDPKVPKLPKIAVALAVAYLLWPVDLVPDFVFPVAGYLDDATFVWLALRWLLQKGDLAVPPEAGEAPRRLRP